MCIHSEENSRNNYISPESKVDPIKILSKDYTKPIWNCAMKVDCRVVHQKESIMESISQITKFNKILRDFLFRYKSEHEDESGFRVNMVDVDMDCEDDNEINQETMESLQSLLASKPQKHIS